jgi:LPS-assembly protein
MNTNWVLTGAARYDIDASKVDQYRFGVGYIDDCFIMSLNYITDYGYNGNVEINHAVMFQVSLRTLGGSAGQ